LHWNRDNIARMLGRAPSSVHLFEGHVGGGFGIRGELYPEDVLVCLAALRLGRPVKWIEDRREHLIAANHSRSSATRSAAVTAGGIPHRRQFTTTRALVRTHATRVAMMTCGVLPGYRARRYRAVCHFRLTNKTPAATYRAPGRPRPPSCASGWSTPSRINCGSIRSMARNAVTVEMPFKGRWRRWARKSIRSGDYHALPTRFGLWEWKKLRRIGAGARTARWLGLAMFVEKAGWPADGDPGRHFRRGRGDHRRRPIEQGSRR
jgi:hypothetical protein